MASELQIPETEQRAGGFLSDHRRRWQADRCRPHAAVHYGGQSEFQIPVSPGRGTYSNVVAGGAESVFDSQPNRRVHD